MEPQEVASCCRMGAGMMAGGRLGPRLAQVRMDTLFVRDGEFLYDVAMDMASEWSKVGSWWLELKRANELSDRENGAVRRMRSEALVIASELVDVMRHLQKNHPERWQAFEKMVRKQTVRKIMRRVKKEDRGVVRGSILWCAQYIERQVGADRLERLLTLRSEMA